MCGIVGYTGSKQAAPILLSGLSKLEYRGYDSAGIAVRDGDGDTDIIKACGKLRNLADKTLDGKAVKGNCGIGHTRWATHGEPSEINAHPHCSDDRSVIAVHNGIIENYSEIKDKLLRKGYTFYSGTDTEAFTKLIDYYYKKYKVGPIDAIAKAMVRVRGSYAVAVMFRDFPAEIYVARKDSPMIIGEGDGECFVASDVPAILEHTRQVYYIDNFEMAKLTPGGVVFYNLDGDEIHKNKVTIEWDAKIAERGGYRHFMLKEIHEQPKAVQDTINKYVKDKDVDLAETGLSKDVLKNINTVHIAACGSAYHAGVVAQYVIEDLAKTPVRVELASEFRYRTKILDKNDLVVIISQSGETADSLAALREAKELGIKTLAIVNVLGSSIAREADYVMYTQAGPEIAVATTKAYSAQLIACYLLAMALGKAKGAINGEKNAQLMTEMFTIPEKIERVFEDKQNIQMYANKLSGAKSIFFIGRGIDYAIALEASLKCKEISYIHSEAYAAGELKHGPISLIEDGIPVIAILTQDELYEKTVSNLVETKSRGAHIAGITVFGGYGIEKIAKMAMYVPKIDEHFAASIAIIPIQLFSYYIAVARGLDVDKPRNLAKSVTVE